ncbi:hypothetical protein BCR44DRAFT_257926, partial [Catenaria anguillulae PL171]
MMAPSPIASSPAASVISELPCEDIPSQLPSAVASPIHGPIKSPAAEPVAESPSLVQRLPVTPSNTATPSLAPVRQLIPDGITSLPADPIPEDAYEDDFSDFGAGETASHASSKSNSANHSRSSTQQSAANIEVGATDSEPESDAEDEESSHDDESHSALSKSSIPTLAEAVSAEPRLIGANNQPLKSVIARPLVSMHEASDIDEDIDEEIEVFEDESEAAD